MTWGVLYSHASRDVYADLVDGPFATMSAACERLGDVLRAQPGIFGVIVRQVDGKWQGACGRSPAEILRAWGED
jgi:hypothetical protein